MTAPLQRENLSCLQDKVLIGDTQHITPLQQYEHIIHELEVLLDALDNLSNGLLCHSVIRPRLLQNFLKQVELDFTVHYPEYELVLDRVEHYYNLPLIC